ncbi:MAG TPA: hypothetical protein GXX55_07540 [Firmicutes bacterium]|nr:hypothetical protein [Bacillota bacterium]
MTARRGIPPGWSDHPLKKKRVRKMSEKGVEKMSQGFAFPGTLSIVPTSASPGSPVRVEIRISSGAPPVSRIEAEVAGYGIRYPIYGNGERFAAEVQVPWEAPPGQYQIFFYAYTPSGEMSQAQPAVFTVV